MKNLKTKMKKQGGFTLVEMLIVVAIIAILIAISIPLINNSLEKARDATDDANFRNAAALGEIMWLTSETPITTSTTYWYVIDTTTKVGGVLKEGSTAPAGTYESKCTESGKYSVTGTSSGKKLQVVIDPTQTDLEKVVQASWAG